jgi:hypothetical protein
LSIVIRVPQKNFRLNDTFLRSYHANSLQEAASTGKVYGIKNLPSLLAEENTSIVVQSPLTFQIEYPWWPPLVFVFLGALLVLSIYLLVRLLLSFLGSGEVWEATLTSPSEAKGKIQGGWVSVPFRGTAIRIGRIKGQTFVPVTGISPKNHPQTIKEGAPLTLFYRDQQLSLIFRKMSVQTKTNEAKPNGRDRQIKI